MTASVLPANSDGESEKLTLTRVTSRELQTGLCQHDLEQYGFKAADRVADRLALEICYGLDVTVGKNDEGVERCRHDGGYPDQRQSLVHLHLVLMLVGYRNIGFTCSHDFRRIVRVGRCDKGDVEALFFKVTLFPWPRSVEHDQD